jgi:ubiquinone/menaquinone biosynthesis C-methylase UbiE
MSLRQEKEMTKEERAQQFDACLVGAARSPAFSRFCERAYGKHLGQFSSCDMEQLQVLLEMLDLQEGDRVLDLGCGLGMVSEYISDRTGAHVTGIDYASRAIEEARRRTETKSDRITFENGDMDAIDLRPESFDAIIAIDSLYFTADMKVLIGKLKKSLKPDGHLAIFHSQALASGENEEVLHQDCTPVAVTLAADEFTYDCRDLTDKDVLFWQRSKETAKALQPEFDAEGNPTLCNGRIGEGDAVLNFASAGHWRRYLYNARMCKA